jgi:Asp-tRNA(Asn)/Glu-tRNA(Gln) amidotransferase A subunit family amidase
MLKSPIAAPMMAGIPSSGLPLSVQFVGRNFAEPMLLQIARNGSARRVPIKSIDPSCEATG